MNEEFVRRIAADRMNIYTYFRRMAWRIQVHASHRKDQSDRNLALH